MTEQNKTVHDRMLNGKPMILINNNEKTPTYRVLVQTPTTLDYDFGSVNYTEDSIREAMPSLVGYDVTDELTDHERNLGLTPKPFAHITNAGYCPDYGGYADLEIFNKDYEPVFENMLRNKDKTKRKFSTEVLPLEMPEVEDGSYRLDKFDFDGLVMTTRPRDASTGLCDVILNSTNIIKDIGGSDMPEYNKEDIEQFQTRISELEDENKTLKTDYEEGKRLYEDLKPEDFKEYQELLTEKEALYTQLVPVWTAQEGEKLELVNSLVEKLPEDEQEAAQARFTEMETADLKLLNSLQATPAPTPKGVTSKGADEPPEDNGEALIKDLEDLGYFD